MSSNTQTGSRSVAAAAAAVCRRNKGLTQWPGSLENFVGNVSDWNVVWIHRRLPADGQIDAVVKRDGSVGLMSSEVLDCMLNQIIGAHSFGLVRVLSGAPIDFDHDRLGTVGTEDRTLGIGIRQVGRPYRGTAETEPSAVVAGLGYFRKGVLCLGKVALSGKEADGHEAKRVLTDQHRGLFSGTIFSLCSV